MSHGRFAMDQHLQAVQQLLQSVKDLPNFYQVSACQSASLASAAGKETLTVPEANRLVALVQQLPWCNRQHCEAVTAALASGTCSAQPAVGGERRRKQQSYEAFTNYITDSMWTSTRSEKHLAMDAL